MPPCEFSVRNRNNFFSHDQRVLCESCSKSGVRAPKQAVSERLCDVCGRSQRIDAFRRVGQTREAVCRACEKVHCAGCAEDLPQSAFAATSVSQYFSSNQRVFCTTCTELGRSYRDTTLYLCKGPCGKQLGHMRFSSQPLKGFKKMHAMSWSATCAKRQQTKNSNASKNF